MAKENKAAGLRRWRNVEKLSTFLSAFDLFCTIVCDCKRQCWYFYFPPCHMCARRHLYLCTHLSSFFGKSGKKRRRLRTREKNLRRRMPLHKNRNLFFSMLVDPEPGLIFGHKNPDQIGKNKINLEN